MGKEKHKKSKLNKKGKFSLKYVIIILFLLSTIIGSINSLFWTHHFESLEEYSTHYVGVGIYIKYSNYTWAMLNETEDLLLNNSNFHKVNDAKIEYTPNHNHPKYGPQQIACRVYPWDNELHIELIYNYPGSNLFEEGYNEDKKWLSEDVDFIIQILRPLLNEPKDIVYSERRVTDGRTLLDFPKYKIGLFICYLIPISIFIMVIISIQIIKARRNKTR